MSSDTLHSKALEVSYPYSDDDITTLSKALKNRDNIPFYQCPNFSEDPTSSKRTEITTGIFSHNNQTFIELPAISDPELSPISDRLREQLEFLTYLSSLAVENPITVRYPVEILAPYKLEHSWHWNVLKITIDKEKSISCKRFSTDGKSYPVGPQVFADITDFFENFTAPNGTSYQSNPSNQIGVKIEYENFIQSGVNCGLGSAVILHDLITGKKPGQDYDALSQKSDQELRQIAFDIVENYNTESLVNLGKEDATPEIENPKAPPKPLKRKDSKQATELDPKTDIGSQDQDHETSDGVKEDFQDDAEQNEKKDESKTKKTKSPEPLTDSESQILQSHDKSDRHLARTLNQNSQRKPRSYSGIGISCNASYNKSKSQFELTIAKIIPGSMADKLGLKTGDVITYNSQTDSQQILQKAIMTIRNIATSSRTASESGQEIKVSSGNPPRSQDLYTKISSQTKTSSAKIFIHKGESNSRQELVANLKSAEELATKSMPKTSISGQIATKEQKEREEQKESVAK